MCQAQVDGGRRCAAHARPAFQSAVHAVNTARSRQSQTNAQVAGLDAVAQFAATPSGKTEVAAMLDHAHASGDTTLVAFLGLGQDKAVAINTRYAAVEAQVAAAQAALHPAIKSSTLTVVSDEQAWDPGTPTLTAGEHWSIADGGTRWQEGGCGAFAIGMAQRWPHLKIACEMYDDHGADSVAHAWAYDPATNKRFHIFGAEDWKPTTRPDYDPDSHKVLLDQSPEDVQTLFRGFNCSEDAVMDATDVACEMFDPEYTPDDEYDRQHLYFW